MKQESNVKSVGLTKKETIALIEAIVFTLSTDVCLTTEYKLHKQLLDVLVKLTYNQDFKPKLKHCYLTSGVKDNFFLAEIIKNLVDIKTD